MNTKVKNKSIIVITVLIGYFFVAGCSLHYLDENVNRLPKLNSKEQARIFLDKGDKEFKKKNFVTALRYYDKALFYFEHPVIYKKIAFTLKNLGKYDEAKIVFDYAINLQKGGEKK